MPCISVMSRDEWVGGTVLGLLSPVRPVERGRSPREAEIGGFLLLTGELIYLDICTCLGT